MPEPAKSVICLSRYWNYVAVPYSILLLFFGVYTLFNMSNTQLTGDKLAGTMKSILSANLMSKEDTQQAAAAAAAAKPAVAPRGAASSWQTRLAKGRQRLGAMGQAIRRPFMRS